jgi:hypothetical protein
VRHKVVLLSVVLVLSGLISVAAPAAAEACTVTHGSGISHSNPLLNVTATVSTYPTYVTIGGIQMSPQSKIQLDGSHWLTKWVHTPPFLTVGHVYNVVIHWDSGSCAGSHTSTITVVS